MEQGHKLIGKKPDLECVNAKILMRGKPRYLPLKVHSKTVYLAVSWSVDLVLHGKAGFRAAFTHDCLTSVAFFNDIGASPFMEQDSAASFSLFAFFYTK